MACVTAIELRTHAREAMLAAGGRGFMRFLPPGGALLATDACRRCADEQEKQQLETALDSAGFICQEQDGLLMLTPKDTWFLEMDDEADIRVDWDDPEHMLCSLCVRWTKKEKRPLTDAGRRLIVEALRLSWQSAKKAAGGLDALRAQGAVMQRRGDTSGMHEAGRILLDWYNTERGGRADEA